jgi:hypothetical protein
VRLQYVGAHPPRLRRHTNAAERFHPSSTPWDGTLAAIFLALNSTGFSLWILVIASTKPTG